MDGGLNQLWQEWATQILILLSFTLQNFLFVFARTRRRGSSAVLRILLWLAYLVADSTAVYTLGHLSTSGSPHEQNLAVFWAPFLLVHLGSQDTITAYSLEDNQLWPRHVLNLGIQAFGVAYVLYKHITGIPTSLGFATVLIFIVGVIKYGERIWALKCATFDNIRSSINAFQFIPAYYSVLLTRGRRVGECDEEELLLFAQAILPLCKGAMVDFPVTVFRVLRPGNQMIPIWNWKATWKVVEMELSLMYDILYTKAAVIHTWYGYLFRLVSPLATAAAFIMFQSSGNKEGYNKIDVAITYILLVGSFLLDMASVLSTLGSTWTCNFLLSRDWSWPGLGIMSLRRRFKAAASIRGWSGSIGQYNLFHFCSRDLTRISKVAKMIGLEDWWNKLHYSKTLVVSEDVKELVFKRVWELAKEIHHPDEVTETMPSVSEWTGVHHEDYDDTAKRRKKFDDALNLGAQLQELILTWHIFTNVLLFCGHTPVDAAASSVYVKAINALSDYMVFFVAASTGTVPGEIRGLYEATTHALRFIWEQEILQSRGEVLRDGVSSAEKAGKLASILQSKGQYDRGMSSITLWHGALYARLMLELADAGKPDKLGIISSYQHRDRAAMGKLERLMPSLESSCSRGGVFDMPKVLALVLDTWVHLLVWASARCSREAHASQISRGSELTTVVWLIEEHASLLFNQDESSVGPAGFLGRRMPG